MVIAPFSVDLLEVMFHVGPKSFRIPHKRYKCQKRISNQFSFTETLLHVKQSQFCVNNLNSVSAVPQHRWWVAGPVAWWYEMAINWFEDCTVVCM